MKFNVGDQVKLLGTVKESVADKGGSTRVSVLIGTLDEPGNPSKEYWVNEADLEAAGGGAAAGAAAGASTGSGDAPSTPLRSSASSRHTTTATRSDE